MGRRGYRDYLYSISALIWDRVPKVLIHTQIFLFSRAVVLKLGHTSESPGKLVTTDG